MSKRKNILTISIILVLSICGLLYINLHNQESRLNSQIQAKEGAAYLASTTETIIKEYTVSNTITAKLYSDGTLKISGNGEIPNYSGFSDEPWDEQNEQIKNVIIENNITRIGDYALSNLTNLTNVTIPESVVSIGFCSIYRCTKLSSITIPKSVTKIGKWAFDDCNSLREILVDSNNQNYKSIDGVLFDKEETRIIKCPEGTLEQKYTIPENVTDIDGSVFNKCTNLKEIEVDSNNQKYKSIDGVVFNKEETKIVKYPEGKDEQNYIIKNSVTAIENWAFYNCTKLINITIPENVTIIGDSAFDLCKNLKNLIIPEKVTSIGANAFYNCNNLTEIIIPESVTDIKERAFCDCSNLTKVIIPENVTNIGSGAFYNCNNIKIYCKTNSKAKEYAETNKISYIIDDEAPTIDLVEIKKNENNTTLKVTAEDKGTDKNEEAGLANKPYSFDGGKTWQKENVKEYTENNDGIIVLVKDALGNIAQYKETLNVTVENEQTGSTNNEKKDTNDETKNTNNDKKDTKINRLPNAGNKCINIVCIIIAVIVAVILYIKYKRSY